jgi:hypothetical protein
MEMLLQILFARQNKVREILDAAAPLGVDPAAVNADAGVS